VRASPVGPGEVRWTNGFWHTILRVESLCPVIALLQSFWG